MLRACTISFPKKWDKCLKLAEFSYNNSYQESIRMAPFEDLYGRKCRMPLNWVEVGDHGYFGPELIQVARDQVSIIRSHLKAAQSRQKAYADKRKRPLEFAARDYVYLGVSYERGASVWHSWQASPSICGSISGVGEMWSSCLPSIASRYSICSTQCVPCITTEEVFAGS